jgi:hypothetical protein
MNYTKSIKLFCEMADIPIRWKKITRGLSRSKKYDDCRNPTLEALRKPVEYLDARLRLLFRPWLRLVYGLVFSGLT